jgi:hypothetical protein
MWKTTQRLAPFLLAAASLALLGPPAAAQGGATLYADDDYRGSFESFAGDAPRLRGTRVGNDAASSVRVAPGCTVRLYEDESYRGRETTLTADAPRLGATPAGNDRVSSLRVSCFADGARGVVLYGDADYRGREGIFYRDTPDLGRDPFPNDAASSLRVPDGCSVTVYEHPDYRGRSSTFYRDDPALGDDTIGNDRVSSLRVLCGVAAPGPATPPGATAVYRCAERSPAVAVRVEERGRDRARAVLLLGDAEVARFRVDRERDLLHLRSLGDLDGELQVDLRRQELAVRRGNDVRTLCRLR